MIDFVARIIGSGNDFPSILIGVLVYVGLLWFLFSFWVFLDAKKRYKNWKIAIIFFLVVLIFNFPSLVFYLLVRPEDEGDFVVFPADNLNNRGVNVPIVNFVGEDGKVQFSFELNISKNNSEVPKDMTINVDWNSQNNNFKTVEQEKRKEDHLLQTEIVKSNGAIASFNMVESKKKAVEAFNKAKTKFKSVQPKFSLPAKEKKNAKKK